MAPFRGGSRSGRFQARGRGGQRGGRGGRGGSSNGGKLARSGIRTRNGYKKFDSQRIKEVDSPEPENESEGSLQDQDSEDDVSISTNDVEQELPKMRSYSALLQSFAPDIHDGERSRKRRRINVGEDLPTVSVSHDDDEKSVERFNEEESDQGNEREDDLDQDAIVSENLMENGGEEEGADSDDQDSDHEAISDPYTAHLDGILEAELTERIKSIESNSWHSARRQLSGKLNAQIFEANSGGTSSSSRSAVHSPADMYLKQKLQRSVQKHIPTFDKTQQQLAPFIGHYQDVLVSNRSADNAESLRSLACLEVLNHVLKGRDKILRNAARLAKAAIPEELDLRDQGFTRPRALILLETRQMAARYAEKLADLFEPEQQENQQRFKNSFTDTLGGREDMPEDFCELFDGNDDNNFLTAIKLTRRTLKFYSAFYTSDIIIASPLGLRRVIENEDAKKRDHDFLSSIEVVIVDQADAMQMQNWENVELVFNHLNLQLKEAHDCDFNRVRHWYLDGNAKYLRQTIVFSAYLTPELNRLFNHHMQNVSGKVKMTPAYDGIIGEISSLDIKQTFTRFNAASPANDPDARFKYFTTAVLPALLRIPKPSDNQPGILVFIPSYFDFLRVRNFFATSSLTENISFGAIHDYSEVSEQRRARSHFSSGRHSVLLYTQRAHHFYRLRIKSVKRVVMYGLPDNPIFYQEIAGGFVGTTIGEGKADPVETGVRNIFSKWDGLRLERIVGTVRVKGMLGGVGDTFDFV